ETQLYAEPPDVVVEERQKFEPADRGEPVARDGDHGVIVDDGDVGPVLEVRRQVLVERFIVGTQEFERPVGEDDAKAPRRVPRIAFEDDDVMRRVAPLHQRREIQAGGAGAEDPDLHRSFPPPRGGTSSVPWSRSRANQIPDMTNNSPR